MSFSDIFSVIKELVLDWRLIVAFVVVLLYLNFVFYVSRYKKKTVFKPKRVIQQDAAMSAAPQDGAQASESPAEEPSGDDVFV